MVTGGTVCAERSARYPFAADAAGDTFAFFMHHESLLLKVAVYRFLADTCSGNDFFLRSWAFFCQVHFNLSEIITFDGTATVTNIYAGTLIF